LDEAIDEHMAKQAAGGVKRAKGNGGTLEKWRLELVLTHCYPRLDENVSKMQNHLLKSPFCIHPKTGRVCVPIDPSTARSFDPMAVPTLATLMTEINQYDKAHGDKAGKEGSGVSDCDKTSLSAYLKSFDKLFLGPLYRDLRRAVRAEAELEAAAMGDF